ncbi:defensin-like protein 1 [Lycium barbarum]|uniref:defensin-like protein 1 n=1 Tax=Lycium barbarum TaxID=112863 RepID=UPI00293EFAA8|nr:defensin-like protein 1 [Lycium barbarum]
MAKSQFQYAAFLALVLFFLIASTDIQVAESIGCEKLSKTWFGLCLNSDGCNDQCINWEHAIHGACHFDWGGPSCYCYFCN